MKRPSSSKKAQGLGKGGHVERLGVIMINKIEQETLGAIIRRPIRSPQPWQRLVRTEPEREGFPACTPEQFVEMFCRMHKCKSTATVYRIEFEHVPGRWS
jgi:hypothetical protein